MRKLNDHIVPGDSANHQLTIEVTDEPGQGGANHCYVVEGFDAFDNPSHDKGNAMDGFEITGGPKRLTVLFQNGPIQEVGVNGVTGEALVAIAIDRLRSFQKGPFACRENAIALTHLEEGLMWLQKRTRDRIMRGVEGTHQK